MNSNPPGVWGVPLSGSFNFNSSMGTSGMPRPSQQPKPQPKAVGAGIKVNKQVIIEDDDDDIGDDAEDYENFANVSTTALEHYGLAAHPSTVCEAATLSSVPSPEVNYSVKLPSDVLKNGAISALQFHAVRLACARHEQKLPDGSRAGFFLGDGPGVGKGRQIAATIFNYFCRGKTKALWVSVSTDLVVDARRDLEALGMLEYEAVKLHDLRQLRTKPGQPLSALPGLDSGIMFCTYDLLCSGATSAKSKKGKGGRNAAARAAAGKGFGLGGSSGFNSGSLGGGLGVGAKSQRSGSMGVWDDENAAPWERQLSPDEEEDEEEEQNREEFGAASRLHQICEWLGDGDYVIVLDECHKAKNAMPKGKQSSEFPIDFGDNNAFEAKKKGRNDGFAGLTKNSSKTARAVIELQRRLPNARVMYVSATGASEAENLCYMERLGLWGPGSAFPTKQEFVGLLKQGGIGAMELVAMELKGAGCYLSRALSWADVRFETVAIDATEEFVSMYDAAVEVWQDTRNFLEHAGVAQRKRVMGQFGSAQLRFFRQLCTAAKVDTVVKLCEEGLAAGMCPVVGIQSTGEARTAEYVASMSKKKGGDEDMEFDSFVEPAALILSSFIEKNLMEYPGAQALLVRAKNLVLPKNPLDDLIDRLGGPAKVAEMTGRQKRMERATGGGYKYVSRTAFYGGCSLDDVNILERSAFQEGRKKVAIISDAASAGISLHADKAARNTAQRVQITLELAWSADKTVQQLGRTHRSNQVQPPIYKIVSTNICGEHRFASAVAHRLQQLGALTQGDRRAASASEALSSFNLQTKWAHMALKHLLTLIQNDGRSDDPAYAALTPPWLEDMMREGYPEGQDFPEPGTLAYSFRRQAAMDRWCLKAAVLFEAVGLYGSNKTPTVHMLLNKLLGMKVEMQGQVFGYFSAILEKVVARAKKEGKYESTGIIKPGCEKITLTSSRAILQHPNGAAPTCLTTFATDRGVNWDKAKKLLDDEMRTQRKQLGDAVAERGYAGFYWTENAVNHRFYSLLLPKNERGTRVVRRGRHQVTLANYYRVVRPDTGMSFCDVNIEDVRNKYHRISDLSLAQREWSRCYNAGMERRLQPLNLITGSVLPLLKTITRVLEEQRTENRYIRRLQLMRVETTEASMQRFIGVLVPDKVLSTMVAAIKGLEQIAPEQRLWQQQQQAKKGSAAAATTAGHVTGVYVSPPAAAGADIRKMLGGKGCTPAAADAAAGSTRGGSAAAATAGTGDAAAAAAEDLPPGLDPAVASLLSAASAAVKTSAALLQDEGEAAAAAAADSIEQQQQQQGDKAADQESSDAEADDGSSYSSEEEETLGQRNKRRTQMKKRRATGRNHMTRADAAAAAADAAANSGARAATVNVVTEELLAAGLWEEGGTDLAVRKGGAAAAGGGGTRWKKFEKAAAAAARAGGRNAGRGSGKRGRPRKTEWLVSDEEEEYTEGAETEEEAEDVSVDLCADAEMSDEDAESVSAGVESEEDAVSGRKGSRGSAKGRAAAKLASCRRAAAAAATAAMAAAAAAETQDEELLATDDEGTADAAAAAAPVATTADDHMPAAAADKPPVKKRGRRSKADIAVAAAEADAAIATAAAKAPQAAAAAAPVVSVSSRGRVRKVKQLPDGYVPLDDVFAAAMPAVATPAAAADTAEKAPEQQQEQHERAEDEQTAAAAEGTDDEYQPDADELAPAAAAEAGEAAPATAPPPAAAASAGSGDANFQQQQHQHQQEQDAPSDHSMEDTAAAAGCSKEPQQQEQGNSNSPAPMDTEARASDAVDTEQAKAAAAVDAVDAEQAKAATTAVDAVDAEQAKAATAAPAEPAATAAALPAEHEKAAAVCGDDGHVSSQGDTPAAAAAVDDDSEADDSELCESALRATVRMMLPGLSASAGDSLSIKAVRLAVEAATGWTLDAKMRAVLKDECREYMEEQQQQEQQQQQQREEEGEEGHEIEQPHQGVTNAVVTKVVRKLLRKGGEACTSTKSVRLAAAARLGLTDLTGPHRSLVKQLVLAHLEQQLAEEEQQWQSQEQQNAAEAEVYSDNEQSRSEVPRGRLSRKKRSQQQPGSDELQDNSLEDPESPIPAAAAAAGTPGSNSKRRRLGRLPPAAGTSAAAATAAAVAPLDVDMLEDDMAGLVDEIMEDLQSPHEQQRVGLNPLNPAATGTGAGSSSSDRDNSPVLANVFEYSPSPCGTAAPAAVAAEPVVLSSWGRRKRRSGWPAAAADTTAAAAAAKPQHRRAVITDSDDEAEEQQPQQQQENTAAAAAAVATATKDSSSATAATVSADVALLQQQLAAATAQVSELQLQRQQQQEVAAASQAESEKLRAELVAAKVQAEAAAAAAATAAAAEADSAKYKSELEQLRAELSALKAQSEAAATAQAESAKLRSEAEHLRAELAALTQQQTAAAAAPAVNSSPAAVTPVPWAGLARAASLIKTPMPAAAAAADGAVVLDDDCPTPRIGSALVSAGSNSSSWDAFKPGQQQQQVPATPITPGTAPASEGNSQQQQQQQQSLPTLDDVRTWLESHSAGATAVQIMKAFSSSSSSKGLKDSLTGVLGKYLQQLVDDVEIVRKGGAAAKSSRVDMADNETLYMALC